MFEPIGTLPPYAQQYQLKKSAKQKVKTGQSFDWKDAAKSTFVKAKEEPRPSAQEARYSSAASSASRGCPAAVTAAGAFTAAKIPAHRSTAASAVRRFLFRTINLHDINKPSRNRFVTNGMREGLAIMIQMMRSYGFSPNA